MVGDEDPYERLRRQMQKELDTLSLVFSLVIGGAVLLVGVAWLIAEYMVKNGYSLYGGL